MKAALIYVPDDEPADVPEDASKHIQTRDQGLQRTRGVKCGMHVISDIHPDFC